MILEDFIGDEVDFSECKFINNAMKFYTFDDFCKNCEIIKHFFNNLSSNGKLFYKWYVYANTHINLNYKNKIWNYLNNFTEKETLLISLKFYKPI